MATIFMEHRQQYERLVSIDGARIDFLDRFDHPPLHRLGCHRQAAQQVAQCRRAFVTTRLQQRQVVQRQQVDQAPRDATLAPTPHASTKPTALAC